MPRNSRSQIHVNYTIYNTQKASNNVTRTDDVLHRREQTESTSQHHFIQLQLVQLDSLCRRKISADAEMSSLL